MASINLAKVNISLQQFQDISSGKYNAGEVKLASETKLAKMNNHVDRTSKNNEKISHAEVIAIKQSLVKALSQHGVGQDEIDGVRQELGLAPAGPSDRTLRFRSVVPLSRQQIREILDRNAHAINRARGPNGDLEHIVGTKSLVDAETAATRAAKRNAVNQALASDRRTVYMDEDIARFSQVVSDAADFVPNDDRPKVLAMAKAQLEALLATCNDRPRENVLATAKFAVPNNGPTIEMPTGLSEKQFAERLENMLVRFSKHPVDQAERDVVSQYRALTTREARQSFLENLPNDPKFGLKARALAIQCLYSRGVSDYATLSVANRLTDQDALDLAKELLALPADAKPDEVRANRVLVAMAAKEPASVPDTGLAYVPATSNAQYNRYVKTAFTRCGQRDESEVLLPAHKKLVETTRQALLERLGYAATELVRDPEWSGLSLNEQEMETKRLTADAIADQFLTGALMGGAEHILTKEVEKTIRDRGGSLNHSALVVLGLTSRHPDLLPRMAQARRPDDAMSIVAEYREEIDRLIALHSKTLPFIEATRTRAVQKVADRLGLAPGVVRDYLGLVGPVGLKAIQLIADILEGKKAFATDKDLEAAFMNLADEAVAEMTGRLDQVDALRLPPQTADEIKESLFGLKDFKAIDVARIAEETRRKVNLDTLEGLLVDNASTDQIKSEMRNVAKAVRDVSDEMLAGKEELGPDDRDAIEHIALLLAVRARPGLDGRIDAFFARPDVRTEILSEDINRSWASFAMETFRLFSTDPEINPLAEIKPRLVRTLFTEPRERAAFEAVDGTARALAAGYHPSEVPDLLKAFSLYRAATNVSDADALAAVLDNRSKAHRLFRYGGRFTESVENFRSGLSLMDRFAEWYAGLSADVVNRRAYDTPTKSNASRSFVLPEAARGYETFLFQDLAIRPDANLDEPDPEKIFGVLHNDATNFFVRGNGSGCLGTMFGLPPARRQVVYAAFRALEPAATELGQHEGTNVIDHENVLARILRHYDEVARLKAAGQLDRAHLNALLTPDLRLPPNASSREVSRAFDARIERYNTPALSIKLSNLLTRTGCTVAELQEAMRGGRQPAPLADIASTTMKMQQIDGTTRGGRDFMLGDLKRPSIPTYVANGQGVLAAEDGHFTVVIGGETIVCAVSGQDEANAHVADRIEALCGPVHVEQANAVMRGLSQAGHGPILEILPQHGIANAIGTEHMPLAYKISKNEATGAVTIRYSQPQGFPFRFHWETTVALDGTSTTTPVVVEKALGNVSAADARRAVEAAAGEYGIRLGRSELNAAANLYARHATGMYPKNAAYLARYIVKLPLSSARENGIRPLDQTTNKVAAFAPELRNWEDFDFGDPRLRPLESELARRHSKDIADSFAGRKQTRFAGGDGSIFQTMLDDAGRQTYTINGTKYLHGTDVGGLTGPDQHRVVIDAFRAAVPDPKARKALSVLMNQSGPGDLVQAIMHVPADGEGGPVNLHELGGADKLINRNAMTGLHMIALHEPTMSFGLDVAPDGRTAVVTITLDTNLEVGDKRNDFFGNALVQERITVDLTPDVPVVTDIRLSQELR